MAKSITLSFSQIKAVFARCACALVIMLVFLLANCSLPPGQAGEEKTAAADTIATVTNEYNKGQYTTALEAAHHILEKDPRNVTVHYLLANILSRSGQLEQALAEYRFCLANYSQTKEGQYSKEAITGLEAIMIKQAVTTPASPAVVTPKPNHQAEEMKEKLGAELQTHLDDRRKTLDTEITRLRWQAQTDIATVPEFFNNGDGGPYRNPDYDHIVGHIRSKMNTKIEKLVADNDNESAKLNQYYKGLSDSYDKTYNNLDTRNKAQTGTRPH